MNLYLVTYSDDTFGANNFNSIEERDETAKQLCAAMRHAESKIRRIEATSWLNLYRRSKVNAPFSENEEAASYVAPLPNAALDFELCLQFSPHSFGPGSNWGNVVCDSHEQRLQLAATLAERSLIRRRDRIELIYSIDLVDRLLIADSRQPRRQGRWFDKRYRCNDERLVARYLWLD